MLTYTGDQEIRRRSKTKQIVERIKIRSVSDVTRMGVRPHAD